MARLFSHTTNSLTVSNHFFNEETDLDSVAKRAHYPPQDFRPLYPIMPQPRMSLLPAMAAAAAVPERTGGGRLAAVGIDL
ncbi:hypothetical protein PoB_003673700 [Plakobranchus ocellatus]|uniref:Uncharacterized protein n=1 Tax=Plakobranchus ocellatus TaxID=259542 RepID=A0AAV4ATH4_9GAST|nr:hypothetical protein PoB_003673700 [Plakobranchus ocellatus]